MIYKFSGYLTRLLCKESMISDDQEELYDYGFPEITIANMTEICNCVADRNLLSRSH